MVLEPIVTTFAVYEAESNSYCGLLEPRTATIVQELLNLSQIRVLPSIMSKNLQLKIYGSLEDSEMISDQLSSRGLFLQQPQQRSVTIEYFNPHYLVRPGTTFQDTIEDTSIGTQKSSEISPTVKSKVYQLLDSASGPTNFVEAKVSSRLKTELKQ